MNPYLELAIASLLPAAVAALLFLLDEKNLIDCGPDFGAALMRFNIDVTELDNVFITHTHADHFDVTNATFIPMSVTRDLRPVDIWLSEEGYAQVMSIIERSRDLICHTDAMKAYDNGYVRLHSIPVGKPVSVGTFGGAGANTLTRKHPGYYEGCTDDYLRSVDRLLTMHPDVFIANHTWNNDTEGKGLRLLETGVNDFVGENNDWEKFLHHCHDRCLRTIQKDKDEGRL